MNTERDNPYYDLGYTTPEEAAELRNARIQKATKGTVSKVVKKPLYRGRPSVGEDGVLLNVDTEPRPLSNEEREAALRGAKEREQKVYDNLYRQWLAAQDQNDVLRAVKLHTELGRRDKRQKKLGRPPIEPTIPGLDIE